MFYQPSYVGFRRNHYLTNMLEPTQHTVNSFCYKRSSPGGNNVTQDTNHMNNSLISVFSAFIFTQGSAVGGETGHTVQCRACQKTASAVCLQLAFLREWFHSG